MTATSHHRLDRPLWQRLIRALIYVIVLMIDVAGIGLTLIGIGWVLVGDTNLFTWHFSSLMPAMIALSPIIALIGLMGRRRWFAFHLVPALMFIVLYGFQFIPRDVPVDDGTAQLRMMTFNTRYRAEGAPQLAEVILASDADVIALQELSEPAAEYFADHLMDVYPYQITHTNGLSVTGRGLLSRYPLTNDSLETLDKNVYYLRAEFEFDGETITVVNAHVSPPGYGIAYNSANRSRQVDRLLDRLEQDTGALILLGDFNTTQHSDDYAKLANRYHDSFRTVGWGLGQTFPDGSAFRNLSFFQPLIRIDYIFHNDDLRAVSSQAWHSSGGSDHRPVVTDFILQ